MRLHAAALAAITTLGLALAPAAASAPFLSPVGGSPYTLDGGASEPLEVAFGPGGSQLVVSDGDGDSTTPGDVSSFTVSPDRTLSEAAGSPIAAGGDWSGPVAFSTTGLVAVANAGSGTVSVFTAEPDGALSADGSPVATGPNPYALAFSPDGHLLAVSDVQHDTVSVYEVSDTGALSLAETTSPFTGAPYDVGFSPDGRLLAVADFGGAVDLYAVASDGTLAEVSSTPVSDPQSLAFASDSGQLIVGQFSPDQLRAYVVGPGGSSLTAVPGSAYSLASQPEELSSDGSGDLLAVTQTNGVVLLHLAPDGTMGQVPDAPLAIPAPASLGGLALNPAGTLLAFVYDEDSPPSTTDNTLVVDAITRPTATIAAPASGQAYAQDQVVPTSFSCADAASDVSIADCSDSDGATGDGGTLDTSHPGTFSYVVTATDSVGLTARAAITYTVRPRPQPTVAPIVGPVIAPPGSGSPTAGLPSSPVVRLLRVRRLGGHRIALTVSVTAPGRVAVAVRSGRRLLLRRGATIAAAGTATVVVRLDRRVRGWLARARRRGMTVRAVVRFTPVGGAPEPVGVWTLARGR